MNIRVKDILLKNKLLEDIRILGKLYCYHMTFPYSELTAVDFIDFFQPNDTSLNIEQWVDIFMIRSTG